MSIQVNFHPALAQQSPLPTLDSLPNRAILLKYKNHEGPNSVQVSPPYFSTLKLSPPRNTTALTAFSLGGPLTVDRTDANGVSSKKDVTGSDSGSSNTTSGKVGVAGEGQRTTPPSSSGSTNSNHSNHSNNSNGSHHPHGGNGVGNIATPIANLNMRSPVLIHSKAAFKPVWDKDRDRDDNWDASSVSSDCSESDSSLEWWYTVPPRPTLYSTTGTAATAASASIAQPELTVRADRETSSLVFCETTPSSTHGDTGKDEATPNVMTSLTGHLLRSALAGIGSNTNNNGGGGVGGGLSNITPPNSASAYRGLPHPATSPLAREIKFDTDSLSSSPRITPSRASGTHSPVSGNQVPEKDPQELYLAAPNVSPREEKWEESSVGGSFVNENGDLICEDERGDPGVESLKDPKKDSLCVDRERGWVGSMSRWFWSADGTRVQEPNGQQ